MDIGKRTPSRGKASRSTVLTGYKIIPVDEFDVDKYINNLEICPRGRGSRGTRAKKDTYYKQITAFDIETTRIDEQRHSLMYIWQWAVDSATVIIGRTWESLRAIWLYITERIEHKLIVYIHNLAYEFQFLSGIFDFNERDVFAIKSRTPIKATIQDKLELRCSYKQTNMSLGLFTAKIYDYNKKRWPHTELSAQELEYVCHDVIGLIESLEEEMRRDGDTVYTIPLTSTGYVRRDVNKVLNQLDYKYLPSIRPSYPVYVLLREAFRGGDTHANRYVTGEILNDVKSIDISSAYPFQIVCEKYPITRFVDLKCYNIDEIYNKYIKIRKKAILMRVTFSELILCNTFEGSPYLSIDKAINTEKCKRIVDNGRILYIERATYTLTDKDYEIVKNQYTWSNIEVKEVYASTYGYLPTPLRNLVLEYYKNKTELKGIEEQKVYYDKYKNLINAIYGLFAQNPIKRNIMYVGGENQYEEDMRDIAELYSEQIEKSNLPYQWGIWTTALTRHQLYMGRKHVEQFVYNDTDSIKYCGDVNIKELNKPYIKIAKENNAMANDKKGVTHYMGVFEAEPGYDRFVTLGAKKYAYEQGGHIGVTVSGVARNKIEYTDTGEKITVSGGGYELEKSGGLEAFKTGYRFIESGGFEVKYNDNDYYNDYVVDGYTYKITKNVYLSERTYTLGLSKEYDELLKSLDI